MRLVLERFDLDWQVAKKPERGERVETTSGLEPNAYAVINEHPPGKRIKHYQRCRLTVLFSRVLGVLRGEVFIGLLASYPARSEEFRP